MKILFLTLVSFTSIEDRNIYTDLLKEFLKNGHEVYIITPVEKKRNLSTNFTYNDNCTILSLQIGNIQKTGFIQKGLTTLSIEPKYIKSINKYFSNVKFDLILYSTPPITLQKVVSYVKKRDSAKTYLLLKDIFPQNALDLRILNKVNPIYWYFRHLEKKLYRISDFIGCMSQANVKYVLKHNLFLQKEYIEVCPNSINVTSLSTLKDKKTIRAKYGLPIDKTIYIYGGNFGKPQGIDFLIKCIDVMIFNNISLVIIGSGTDKYKIKNYLDLSTEETKANLFLFNELSKDVYDEIVSCCDVGMVFLDYRFTIPNFPSRILSYMDASLPILAVTDKNTDLGMVIEEAGFGIWCESNYIGEFTKKLAFLTEPTKRFEMGRRSRIFLEENYTSKQSYDIIMKHFI